MAEEVGIREFREKLAAYLHGGKPLAITSHGDTLGFFIPTQKRDLKKKIAAMRKAAKELDATIASWGLSEEELMEEVEEIRRADRAKKQTAKQRDAA